MILKIIFVENLHTKAWKNRKVHNLILIDVALLKIYGRNRAFVTVMLVVLSGSNTDLSGSNTHLSGSNTHEMKHCT